MPTSPELIVHAAVMLRQDGDRRALAVSALDHIAGEVTVALRAPGGAGLPNPLTRPVGEIRLLEVQAQCCKDDLVKALHGQRSDLPAADAIHCLGRMGVLRWEWIVEIRRALPALSARLVEVTGTPDLSRRVRDAVAVLVDVEEFAGRKRAELEELMHVHVEPAERGVVTSDYPVNVVGVPAG